MHPNEVSRFRKIIIELVTIAFCGALMVYTANANLDLLRGTYPNPSFVIFGLLALEGGIVYWTLMLKLHWHGGYKALAIFCLIADAIMSGIGFFYDMEKVTSTQPIQLPPVIEVIAFSVLFNACMGILFHVLPSVTANETAAISPTIVESQLVRRDDGPNPLGTFMTGMIAPIMEKGESYRERRKNRKQEQMLLEQTDSMEDTP